MLNMNETTSNPVWVTDIEFGGERPIKNVPIKLLNGSMFYADRGQTVQVRRSTFGSWQIIGPGDRLNSIEVTKTYSLATGNQVGADQNSGFTFVVQVYEFYAGPTAVKGNPALTFDNTLNQVTRTVGDFRITTGDGFAVGQQIAIQGTVNNDFLSSDNLEISVVAELALTFINETITDEAASTGIGLGVVGSSLFAQPGFPPYPEVTLVNADGVPV
jgi:hypothetical protein